MLWCTKGQCINACTPCSFPFLSAHVVACARRIEQADRKMAYRVAPQDDAVLPAGCAKFSIERDHDLSIGECAVIEMPVAPRGRSTHLASPLSEQLPGGEVMLDQFKAPLARLSCDRWDGVKCLRNGRIVCQRRLLVSRSSPARVRQQQIRRGILCGTQRPNPQARNHIAIADCRCELGEAWESRWVLIAIVNYRERPDAARGRKR